MRSGGCNSWRRRRGCWRATASSCGRSCRTSSQISELYPDNWETFLGNAGMWQVFAVNDQTTARYMSERLGEHIVWRKQRTFNQETQKYEEEWMPQGASFLRTGIELGAKSAGTAAIR